jgi:hypothetical protein
VRNVIAQQPASNPDRGADAAGLAELQTAMEELTAVLQRLTTLPDDAEEERSIAADPAPRRRAPAPRLARELRKLLQEIEAAP